jgi:hypothetical protein
VSGDGYITEADALDLTLRLAAHFGYEVTRPEPEPVEPALPEVGKVYAVTENYPYLASLVRGDLVRVVSLGTSSAGFPVARVRRVADADTYPYSVHAVDHLEPEPVDEHESTPARYPCDCPLCAN